MMFHSFRAGLRGLAAVLLWTAGFLALDLPLVAAQDFSLTSSPAGDPLPAGGDFVAGDGLSGKAPAVPKPSWTIRFLVPGDGAGKDTPSTGRLEITLDLPGGYHAFRQEQYLRFDVAPTPGVQAGDLAWSETDSLIEGTPAYGRRVVMTRNLTLDSPEPRDLEITLAWQICDETGLCFRPEKAKVQFRLDPAAGGPDSPGLPAPAPADLLLMLVLAFLGGLVLNVMPCVLPVLSLKVMALTQDAPGDRGTRRLRAAGGLAGMTGGVLALGLATLLVQAGGQAAGWGFQFQNPHFVMVLTLLVWVMALGMTGLWELRVATGPRQARSGPFGTGVKGTGVTGTPPGSTPPPRGRAFLQAAGEGLVMVALATPCSAPFLGTATGFALSSPGWVTLAVFAALGLGLGLPFFLLAWFPGTRRLLPRPGPWMDVFRTLMGFVLAGTAVWLYGIVLGQVEPADGTRLAALALALAAALWLWNHARSASGTGARVARIAAVLVLAGGIAFLYPFAPGSPGRTGTATEKPVAGIPGTRWETFSPEAVDSALAEGRPVFVDFGADWCLTCKLNEAGVLEDPAALGDLAALGTVFLRGDFTRDDPVLSAWMLRNGRGGVPFYQVLGPGGHSRVLPELPSAADLKAAAQELSAAGILPSR